MKNRYANQFYKMFVALIVLVVAPAALSMDRVRQEARIDEAVAAFGVTGKDVVVAILDRGIDYTHPDFINDDGTTRIKWILDMTGQGNWCDVNNPSPVEYSEAQINTALSGGAAINTRDAVGHGTVTAGIAAGNGRAFAGGKYRGVATEADLIVVKWTSDGVPAHGNQAGEAGFVACFDEAMDWLETKMDALGKPVVALANVGTQFGPMDGTSATSRKIDSIFGDDNPGRVWIAPVGDEGNLDNHAGGDFDNSGDTIIPYSVTQAGSYIATMWYDGDLPAQVSVELPNGTVVGPVGPGASISQSGVLIFHYNPGTEFYPWTSTSGDRAVWMQITATAGSGEIRIRGLNAGTGRFDAYGGFTHDFKFTGLLVPGRITDFGATKGSVVVGAYVNKVDYMDIDGIFRDVSTEGLQDEIWHGSSGGPTRDNRTPGVDILTPAHNLIATYSTTSYWGSLRFNLIDDGGSFYGRQGGASGAAPVMVGAAALLLQIDPTLTTRQVRDVIRETAVADGFTGTTPNINWGYGKMDVFAAAQAVVTSQALPQHFSLPDITSDGIEDLAVLREGSVLLEVRSGSNGALQRTIEFFPELAATPITATALPDSDGNGIPELAVLATRDSDGRIVAEVRNLSGAEAPRLVWFALNHTPVTIRAVDDDADNNGVPELAVLSTRNSDGRILVEVKNAFGATNPRSLWYMANNSPIDMEIVPDKDANGVPEVAVLSSRNSDGAIVTELKNAAGAALPTAVWFMSGNTGIDLVAVDDKDANGVPEVAVLSSRNSDGRNVVEIKNAAGPTSPSAVWTIGGAKAIGVAQIHDADNNGVPEVAVLSVRDSDGRIVVQVKNATGPANANAMWYSSGFVPRGLVTIGDTDANGFEEALVLMIRDSDGRILVQGRNAAGSAAPNQYWFSP